MAARKGSGFPISTQPASPSSAPISAKKLRRIRQRIKKRYKRLRKRYKEIHGKRIDWVEHLVEEGDLLVGIRFQDKTYFSLIFTPSIEPRFIELTDVSSGDDVILKQYFQKREG